MILCEIFSQTITLHNLWTNKDFHLTLDLLIYIAIRKFYSLWVLCFVGSIYLQLDSITRLS